MLLLRRMSRFTRTTEKLVAVAAAARGELGSVDVREVMDDAVDLALWRRGRGATGAVRRQGDADGDHDVDGADFLLWQRTFGNSVTAFSGADGNGNGVVDGPDLTLWKGGFGSATVAGQVATAAVPEPSSALLGGLGGLLLVGRFAARRWPRRN